METLRIYKFSLADLDAACFDDTVVVEAPFIRGVDHVGVQDGTARANADTRCQAPGGGEVSHLYTRKG
jgi:hypothetical protein